MWSYEIVYHLNLPKKIVFDTGEISYLYDAGGVKLKKTVTDESTSQITNTHYSEGFQYTEDHLDFFPHAEGYVNVIDYSAFHYVYTYKDHLGNIRLKYTLDPDTNETAILEENHYYPFGLTHQGYPRSRAIASRGLPSFNVVTVLTFLVTISFSSLCFSDIRK